MTSETWRVGDTIADLYEVRGINTEGGMAIVHFVWHKAWQMELVIKSPRPELLADPTARERFVAEAETWVKLGLHPNIVTAYYVREIEGFPRIVMEKMEGGSLKLWLREGRIKDLATALDVAIQVVSGLAYAQKQQPGFVHRDVKPANVLMTPDGEAKVTDFGLVGTVGVRVGTPAYMAPEVWTDPEHVTPAADLYSFGVLLYELLAGRRPFERGEAETSLGQIRGGRGVEVTVGALRVPKAATAPERTSVSMGERQDVQRVTDRSLGEEASLLALRPVSDAAVDFYRQAHLEEEPAPPSRFAANLPSALDELCLSLLTKNADARPARMVDVAAHLRRIFREVAGHTYPRKETEETRLVADGLNNRAVSYVDLGQENRALEAFRQALEASPLHPEAAFNQAMLLWRRCEATDVEAAETMQTIAANTARDWRAHYLLGLVHVLRQDAASATAALEEASRRGADETEVRDALAEVQERASGWSRPLHDPIYGLEGPYGGINGVTISAAGDIAVSASELSVPTSPWQQVTVGSNAGALRVWDVASGQCLRKMWEHEGAPASVAVSADGAYAISGGHDTGNQLMGRNPPRDYTVRVWDLAQGTCMAVLRGHADYVEAVAILPDASLGLSGSRDKTIRVWDLRRMEIQRTLSGHTGEVHALAVSSDGKRALSGCDDGTVRLWDLQSGECLRVLTGHSGRVRAVAFSPNGALALSGGDDRTLRAWRLDTGGCLQTLTTRAGVRGVAYYFDNDFAFSCGQDGDKGYIRIWHLPTGQCVRTLLGHENYVEHIALSSSKVLASADGRHIGFWQIGSVEQPRFRFVLNRVIASEKQHAQAREVEQLVARTQECLRKELWQDAARHIRQARSISGYERQPDLLDIWDALVRRGRRTHLTAHWMRTTAAIPPGTRCLAITRDAKLAITGYSDGQLSVWELATGTCLRKFQATDGHFEVSCVVASPASPIIVSGGEDRELRCWNVESGECVRRFEGHQAAVRSAAITGDGRFLLSVSKPGYSGPAVPSLGGGPSFMAGYRAMGAKFDEHALRIWDFSSGNCLAIVKLDPEPQAAFQLDTLEALPGGRFAVAVSKDGAQRLLDFSSDQDWDLGRPSRCGVFISPDGRYALTGTQDKAQVWDLETGLGPRELPIAHGDVKTMAWFPDSRFALVSSVQTYFGAGVRHEGELSVWDATTGTRAYVLSGYSGAAEMIAIAGSGRFAVTVGSDETESERRLSVWELDWDYEAQEAADWDEGARPLLRMFLTAHTPCALHRLMPPEGTGKDLPEAVGGAIRPTWTQADFTGLLDTLGCAGYGWLRPEGVRRELEKMAANWKGPPTLRSVAKRS